MRGRLPVRPTRPRAWDPDFFERRAILAIRNDQLPPLNDMLMTQVPGDAQTFYSVDSVSTEDGDPAEEATSEYLRLSLLTIFTPLPITAASWRTAVRCYGRFDADEAVDPG